MTMCELVIFGVTCGAQRYDRTVTVTPQHSLVHNAKRAWLVGWYLCRSLPLSHTARALSFPVSTSRHSQHSLPPPSMPVWIHVSSDG